MPKHTETPFKLHERIANSSVGPDKIAISVMMEQLGSISKCLDQIVLTGDSSGYTAEIIGELSDLTFHLAESARRRDRGLGQLRNMSEERYNERHGY